VRNSVKEKLARGEVVEIVRLLNRNRFAALHHGARGRSGQLPPLARPA